MPNKKFVTIKARIPELHQLVTSLGVGPTGDVQQQLTMLIAANLRDFMPRESGRLVGGVNRVTDTKIRVNGPYARFLFFGLTAKGEPVKYDNVNPQGGAHWDRRMLAARGKKIAHDMQVYLRGRRR